jgi:REP-associated tyrosine transposase
MRTGTPGHLKGFDYLGPHRYFLTFCTNGRRHRFTTQAVVDLVLEQISRAAGECRFDVIAYCFMPDHLHLLVEATTDESDCRKFIARAKQYSGFYYSKAYHSTLWQRYGFEHVLRQDEDSFSVGKYIVENPIRASLVERVEDYPFVGSLVYTLPELVEGVTRGPAKAGHYMRTRSDDRSG